MMEVNYFGTLALDAATLLPHMIAAGGGHFAVVTSLMGLFSAPAAGRDMPAPSTPCTAGSRPCRAEHHSDGIRVTMVAPGFVRTAISQQRTRPPKWLARKAPWTPPPTQGITAEQCAAVILRGIDRNKALVTPGKKEVLGYWLSRYAPALLRRVARSAKVT